jgi:RNA polymerase sigma-70 factor, ECF subfamily
MRGSSRSPLGAAMSPIAYKKLPESSFTGRALAPQSLRRFPNEAPGRAVSPAWPARADMETPRAGRNARATELYREYGALVYRRCLRLLKHPDAASDATQEVFAKLVRDLDKLEANEASLRWLYCVATNHCLNHLRDQRRHGEEALDAELELASPSGDAGFDLALVRGVLAHFDVATRAVAVGVLVDGMDYEEVAVSLGVSKRTVSRKLQRFLAVARELTSTAAHGAAGVGAD